jgi:hypothetical protein
LSILWQLARLPVIDPATGAGWRLVRDAIGDETISSNGEPATKEAEALASALNHSAERVQTLWFSFLTFMLYLAIATGTRRKRKARRPECI